MKNRLQKYYKKQFVVDADNNKVAVIYPIDQYMEYMEDLQDLELLTQRIAEDVIPFEELVKQAKHEGIL